jgi:hypothetical protein
VEILLPHIFTGSRYFDRCFRSRGTVATVGFACPTCTCTNNKDVAIFRIILAKFGPMLHSFVGATLGGHAESEVERRMLVSEEFPETRRKI